MALQNEYEIMIKKNPNSDTRSASKDVTKEQFHLANRMHKSDVYNMMRVICKMLDDKAIQHDWTKIDYEDEYYHDFKDTLENGSNFTEGNWYQRHIHTEKHHPQAYCHDDIDLLDIIEMVTDMVCAGIARSGDVYPINIPDEILQKAVANTVTLVKSKVRVDDGNTETD